MTLQQTINSKTLATTILLCGLVGLYFIPHAFLFNNSQTLCIHKRMLGFDCPGCGMTRALYSFLHLDFNTALHLNYGVFALAPLLITEIGLGIQFNKGLFKLKKTLYYILCLALLTIYISRIYTQIIL